MRTLISLIAFSLLDYFKIPSPKGFNMVVAVLAIIILMAQDVVEIYRGVK